MAPRTRAGFLARLIKNILSEGAESHPSDYLDLLKQLSPDASKPAPLPPTAPLEEHYHYWNARSGHSRGLLLPTGETDRESPLTPPIDWMVALDSLRSGYNVGSVFRICDAFGFHKILAGGYTPGPANAAVKSAAMGSQEFLPYEKTDTLGDSLKSLKKKEQRPVIGLELAPGSIPLPDFHFPETGILVLGNEERGIQAQVMEQCDHCVYVPLFGRKHSLNVASSFSITAQRIREYLNLRAN